MALPPEAPPGRTPARHHERALQALARRGRLRQLSGRAGIDFTSNDYLGLAASAELREAALDALARGVPLGAGGSRLLRGNHDEHEALEAEAAAFFGAESALYFGSGFAANAALIGTLPARGDLLVYDELVHASAWDGMAATKATCLPARHNDPNSFDDVIASWRRRGGNGRVWIAVESLYSMDGDVAPLDALVAVAGRHDAMLLIDEAHATGVLGPGGRGLAAAFEGREFVVSLHTCGKALGASGALVTGSRSIRDFLINRARAFIYATAPSPVMAAVVRRALRVVAAGPERRETLAQRVAFTGHAVQALCGVAPSGSQIQPVIVGSDARATALADHMQRAGFDVRAIRPPTVPEGTARLRIVVTVATSEETISSFVSALAQGLETQARGETPVQIGRTRDAVAPEAVSGRQAARFVVSGTGTDVGKTVFAAALTAAIDGVYWKPVQAGFTGGTDTERVKALTGLPDDRFLPEAHKLATPASPHHAAALDGVVIDPDQLVVPLTARPLIIEGAGGLMVPLTADCLMIDVFARWQIPVILVARTALGTINHTLLSIEALAARGIPLWGIAFVGDENPSSEAIICAGSGARAAVRRLGRLPLIEPLTRDTLAAAFSANFDIADFNAKAQRP